MPQINYPFRAVEFYFDALANPFATNWVPLTREDLIPNDATGSGTVYEGGITTPQTWWNLVVHPRGEVYYQPGEEVPTLSEVLSSGDLVSMMKIEIEYHAGNGKIIRRRMDVGTGVDIFITPSTNIKARILVPDPASVPDLLPSSVNNNRDLRVASDVVIGAECVEAPVGRDDALYTQPFYTVQGGDQATARLEVQRGAKEVQFFSDIPWAGVAEFIFERPPFDETNVGDFFSLSAPAETSESNIVIIPQIADVISLEPSVGPMVITTVQRLKF